MKNSDKIKDYLKVKTNTITICGKTFYLPDGDEYLALKNKVEDLEDRIQAMESL